MDYSTLKTIVEVLKVLRPCLGDDDASLTLDTPHVALRRSPSPLRASKTADGAADFEGTSRGRAKERNRTAGSFKFASDRHSPSRQKDDDLNVFLPESQRSSITVQSESMRIDSPSRLESRTQEILDSCTTAQERLDWCIAKLALYRERARKRGSSTLNLSQSRLTREEDLKEEDIDVVNSLRHVFSEKDEETTDQTVMPKSKLNQSQRKTQKRTLRRSNSVTSLNKSLMLGDSISSGTSLSRSSSQINTLGRSIKRPSVQPMRTRSASHRHNKSLHEKTSMWLSKASATAENKEGDGQPALEKSLTLQSSIDEDSLAPLPIQPHVHGIAYSGSQQQSVDGDNASETEAGLVPASALKSSLSRNSSRGARRAHFASSPDGDATEDSRAPTQPAASSDKMPHHGKTAVTPSITIANTHGGDDAEERNEVAHAELLRQQLAKKRLITRTTTMVSRPGGRGRGRARGRAGGLRTASNNAAISAETAHSNNLQVSLNISNSSIPAKEGLSDSEFFTPGPLKKQHSLEDLSVSCHYDESHLETLKLQAFEGYVNGLRDDASVEPELLQGFTPDVVNILSTSPRWDMNIFTLEKLTNYCPLAALAIKHCSDRELFTKLPIDPLKCLRFFTRIQGMYLPHDRVVYHNSTHGADVMHTVASLLDMAPFFTPLEIFAAIVAGAIHDVAHPGFTNNFLINTHHEFALLYNDKSVLENFHVSTAFRLMQDEPEANILDGFSEEERKSIRRLMIQMVLGTDMTRHARHVDEFKTFLASCEEKMQADDMEITRPAALLGEDLTVKDRSLVLSYALHCADLGACTKPWNQTYTWSMRVLEEFWREGDEEKRLGLPIGQLNEREGAEVAKGQFGFVKFVCEPLWQVWDAFVSPNEPSLPLKNLSSNLMLWECRREYEKTAATMPAAQSPSTANAATNNAPAIVSSSTSTRDSQDSSSADRLSVSTRSESSGRYCMPTIPSQSSLETDEMHAEIMDGSPSRTSTAMSRSTSSGSMAKEFRSRRRASSPPRNPQGEAMLVHRHAAPSDQSSSMKATSAASSVSYTSQKAGLRSSINRPSSSHRQDRTVSGMTTVNELLASTDSLSGDISQDQRRMLTSHESIEDEYEINLLTSTDRLSRRVSNGVYDNIVDGLRQHASPQRSRSPHTSQQRNSGSPTTSLPSSPSARRLMRSTRSNRPGSGKRRLPQPGNSPSLMRRPRSAASNVREDNDSPVPANRAALSGAQSPHRPISAMSDTRDFSAINGPRSRSRNSSSSDSNRASPVGSVHSGYARALSAASEDPLSASTSLTDPSALPLKSYVKSTEV